MTSTRPLPARAVPFADESLLSLIRRTALAMGYDQLEHIARLLPDSSAPHWNFTPPGSLLRRLAQLLFQPAETLQAATIHGYAAQFVLVSRGTPRADRYDSKTRLRFFHSAPYVCPVCLTAGEAYERLLWSFRPLPVCLEHGRLLLNRCPGCQGAWRPMRLDLLRCRCGYHLNQAPSAPLSDATKAQFEHLQRCVTTDKAPVSDLSVAAGWWWAERLASAAERTPSWLSRIREEYCLPATADDVPAWLSAAEILSDWPARLEIFLDQFQVTPKHLHTSTGLTRSFGLLLRDAAQLEALGFSVPANALRAYLLARYTRGHLNGKVCLFQDKQHQQLVAARDWMTQSAAARELGLRHGAIAELIRRGLLAGEITPAGAHGRSVGLVSRDSVIRLKEQLRNSIDVTTVAKALGLGRHRVPTHATSHDSHALAAGRRRYHSDCPVAGARKFGDDASIR